MKKIKESTAAITLVLMTCAIAIVIIGKEYFYVVGVIFVIVGIYGVITWGALYLFRKLREKKWFTHSSPSKKKSSKIGSSTNQTSKESSKERRTSTR